MERDKCQAALAQLLTIASTNGYITFDDIMQCADNHSLSIGEFDWLAEMAGDRNIIIYEKEPNQVNSDDEETEDYSKINFEEIFNQVILLSPNLKPLIDYVRTIMPPQRGEVGWLKYQVKEGNKHARERMIKMYMRSAIRIAFSRAIKYDLDVEETIGNAFVGLINAVDKYDPDYSGPFGSFASFWIFQYISRTQNTPNPNIYFSANHKDLVGTVYPLLKDKGCIECEEVFRCKQVIDLICEKLDCDDFKAYDVIMASVPSISLDELTEEAYWSLRLYCSEETLLDGFKDDKNIKTYLDKLPQKQRKVIEARYGFVDGKEHTLDEIGKEMGVSRERIRQIEAKAIRMLCNYLNIKYQQQRDKHTNENKTVLNSKKKNTRTSNINPIIPGRVIISKTLSDFDMRRFVFSVNGGAFKNGTLIILYPLDGEHNQSFYNQIFELIPYDEIYFYVKTTNKEKYWSINMGKNPEEYGKLQIDDIHDGSTNMLFRFVPLGYDEYYIINRDGLYITVNSNGRVYATDLMNNERQIFKVKYEEVIL